MAAASLSGPSESATLPECPAPGFLLSTEEKICIRLVTVSPQHWEWSCRTKPTHWDSHFQRVIISLETQQILHPSPASAVCWSCCIITGFVLDSQNQLRAVPAGCNESCSSTSCVNMSSSVIFSLVWGCERSSESCVGHLCLAEGDGQLQVLLLLLSQPL